MRGERGLSQSFTSPLRPDTERLERAVHEICGRDITGAYKRRPYLGISVGPGVELYTIGTSTLAMYILMSNAIPIPFCGA
jgi:hypothetical protein